MDGFSIVPGAQTKARMASGRVEINIQPGSQMSNDSEEFASENQRIEAVYQDLQKHSPPGMALPTLNLLASPLPTGTPTPTYTEPPYITPTPKLNGARTGAVTKTPTQGIFFTPANNVGLEDTLAPVNTLTPVVSTAAAEKKPAGWLIASGVPGLAHW